MALMSFFQPVSRQDALNSPTWFPWQQRERYLDCDTVDREFPRGFPGIGPTDIRPRSARPRRKINERQSPQFRSLGHHCPIAVGAVHAFPEPRSTHLLPGYLV